MAAPIKRGIDFSRELSHSEVTRDVRTTSERIFDIIANQEYSTLIITTIAGIMFVVPSLVEFWFVLAITIFLIAWYARTIQGLPVSVPKSADIIDPNNIPPGGGKPRKGEGIVFIGNEMKTGQEVWLSDTQMRTHILCMGTTGSGKTELLLSLVFNSLVHDSGFIYIDGKADSSLYAKIYSMARKMGREDDVYVINFQTGAKDIYGAQSSKMSNTLNPFAFGSSGMLSQLIVGLMQQEEGKGGDVWENRAISFVEALMRPLVFMRDTFGMLLDVDVIRSYFTLNRIEEMVYVYPNKFARDPQERKNFHEVLSGLRTYLDNLPGYNPKLFGTREGQSQDTLLQHGYITMQLVRTFNSLADVYGYIMKTPLPEIDLRDVFINRRILVVLLPALEKAPQELTALGRIIVASLKATMAVGLGSEIEGEYSKIIDTKPTTASTPFVCVLDEYGYYAVKGFAVVPAQARSLGFSACFAGQDLPAFEKSSKEEAESTIGNTTTQFCGKMQCTKTFEFFNKLAGQGYYSRSGGFERETGIVNSRYMVSKNSSVERMDRISIEELKALKSGEWIMFRDDKIIRLNGFYANPNDKDVRAEYLRTNHMIRVPRPSMEEAEQIRLTFDRLDAMASRGFVGLPKGYENLNETRIADILYTLEAFSGGSMPGITLEAALDVGTGIEFKGVASREIQTVCSVILAAYRFQNGADESDVILVDEGSMSSGSYNGSNPFGGISSSDDVIFNGKYDLDDYLEEHERAVFDGIPDLPGRDKEGFLYEDYSSMNIFEEESVDDLDPDVLDAIENSSQIAFDYEHILDNGRQHARKGQGESIVKKNRRGRPMTRKKGLLNRDTVTRGLSAVDHLMGNDKESAMIGAEEFAGEIAKATRYPSVYPANTKDEGKEILVKSIEEMLEVFDRYDRRNSGDSSGNTDTG